MLSVLLCELSALQESVNSWYKETTLSIEMLHNNVRSTLVDIKEQLSTLNTNAESEIDNNKNKIENQNRLTEVHTNGKSEEIPHSTDNTSAMMLTTPYSHHSPSQASRTPREMFSLPENRSCAKENVIVTTDVDNSRIDERKTPSRLSNTETASVFAQQNSDRDVYAVDGKSNSIVRKHKYSTRHSEYIVLVEFKRERVMKLKSKFAVLPGEYVVVSADRGEDIGRVKDCFSEEEEAKKADSNLINLSDPVNDSKRGEVLRLATRVEVSQLQGIQSELEDRALEVATEKVIEHNLPMRIIYAEYQFDRRKITLFYESDHKIDFRNLLPDLFKTFHARIWMQKLNSDRSC